MKEEEGEERRSNNEGRLARVGKGNGRKEEKRRQSDIKTVLPKLEQIKLFYL